MFERNIAHTLSRWKASPDRKPLIIRGARQTGKTVAIDRFGQSFSTYLSLNLEKESEKNLFEQGGDLEQIIQAIELAKKKPLKGDDTLLFIDEIQNSPNALKMLRYFFEDYPHLHIVAAGSLLEAVMLRDGFSFPVGRVQFAYLYPATFDEFLVALGEGRLVEILRSVTIKKPPSKVVHDMALKFYRQYMLVGGMPEVVAIYARDRSLMSLATIKEALLTSIDEDVSKYSRESQSKYTRHVIGHAPLHVGEHIKYEKFGNSGFRSREIKQAFDLLEYSMIVQRIYGSPDTISPMKPNYKISPKLLFLDAGLVAHRFGLSQDAVFVEDLNHLFRGALAEQMVGQTLMAMKTERRMAPCFWYRDKQGATAEVDYLVQWDAQLLPIEVKSGASGRLKSLHQFMQTSASDKAIRIYSGKLSVEKINFTGKTFKLISIPHYLQWCMDQIIPHT